MARRRLVVVRPVETWAQASERIMQEFRGAWEAMAGTEDIERWRRTDQYRREIRRGLHKPVEGGRQ